MAGDYPPRNTALDQVLAQAGGEPPAFTVSQLNRQARILLESHFGLVRVDGEISNFTAAASGHWYFTLKDEQAQLRCAMFANRNRRLGLRPRNGQQVSVRGNLGIYEARGDYQLVVEHLRETGLGDLQLQFEALKQKLAVLGWFDASRKRPLPPHPAHIAVVTSPAGAALHDILTVMRRRYPATAVTVFPCQVQGEAAAATIAAAIATANRVAGLLDPPLQALVVARGGGSLEDLWPFNTEPVAQAIHDSALPVVSAVGHEVDFTIADFVADLRAPTPSAAAEALTPDQRELLARLATTAARAQRAMATVLRHRSSNLAQLASRLRHPRQRLDSRMQRLDELDHRLRRALTQQFSVRAIRLRQAAIDLQRYQPGHRVRLLRQRLHDLARELRRAARHDQLRQQQRLAHLAGQLDAISPLATLARGYAIALDRDGHVVMRTAQVAPGDALDVRVSDGVINTTVTGT